MEATIIPGSRCFFSFLFHSKHGIYSVAHAVVIWVIFGSRTGRKVWTEKIRTQYLRRHLGVSEVHLNLAQQLYYIISVTGLFNNSTIMLVYGKMFLNRFQSKLLWLNWCFFVSVGVKSSAYPRLWIVNKE